MKSSSTEYVPAGTMKVFFMSDSLPLTLKPPQMLPMALHRVILPQFQPPKTSGSSNLSVETISWGFAGRILENRHASIIIAPVTICLDISEFFARKFRVWKAFTRGDNCSPVNRFNQSKRKFFLSGYPVTTYWPGNTDKSTPGANLNTLRRWRAKVVGTIIY